MIVLLIIAGLCLVIGLAFNGLGVAGILRFPDVYTRLHAETKATTFGSVFIALSVIFYCLYQLATGHGRSFLILALHTVVAVVLLAFTNAVGAHAIARAAHRSGTKPSPSVTDKFEEAQD
jgi:multicomponent Na+:H+ antiporter subunit G